MAARSISAPITTRWAPEHGRMPPDVVAPFKEEGWRWSGDYHRRKDWMHFEAVR